MIVNYFALVTVLDRRKHHDPQQSGGGGIELGRGGYITRYKLLLNVLNYTVLSHCY